MKLLILANHYNTLRIFRRELLLALSAAGHQVTVSIPPCDEEDVYKRQAYDKIDLAAAKARGVYVCNNKGCNAGAVAEQAIALMLMLLRQALPGDRAVRAGRQMEMKERCMTQGLRELSDCRVGLVGFGDIAKATAQRLAAFGCEVYYYTLHRRSREEELSLIHI